MIRHWKNCPYRVGAHATYFTDAGAGKYGYIGVTDVHNTYYYAQILDNCSVQDMAILDNTAYFCGKTPTGKPLLGWIDLIGFIGSSATLNIDTVTFSMVVSALQSLDNIEVYRDADGVTHVVGYGVTSTGYMGIDYIVPSSSLPYVTYGNLPYIPYDLTLTDHYVVFAGSTADDIVVHPFIKGSTFNASNAPYYTYPVSTATETEPSANMRVTDIGSDLVAVVSYRAVGGLVTNMMLREFDVPSAFSISSLPMLTAYRTTLGSPSNSNIIFDFLYDANKSVYLVFQNYEVSYAYHDVVTKIDVSGGVPSAAQSDYLALSNHPMRSMTLLSDSSKYVVYGYHATNFYQVFWKDTTPPLVPGGCLNSNTSSTVTIPLTSEVWHNYDYGIPFTAGSPIKRRSISAMAEPIHTSCH